MRCDTAVTPGDSAVAIARRRNVTGDPPAISTPGSATRWRRRGAAAQGPPVDAELAGLGPRRRAVLPGHEGEEGLHIAMGVATGGSGNWPIRPPGGFRTAPASLGETGAMADLLTLDRRDDGVAVITLANGKVNALSGALLRELHEAADELAADLPGAVVITGGERIFAAGADISEFGGQDEAGPITASFHGTLDAIAALPRFVIAA